VTPWRKKSYRAEVKYNKDKFKLTSKIEDFFAILKENKRLALQDLENLIYLSDLSFWFIFLIHLSWNL
jgi:hypothetical protein